MFYLFNLPTKLIKIEMSQNESHTLAEMHFSIPQGNSLNLIIAYTASISSYLEIVDKVEDGSLPKCLMFFHP